MIERLMVVVDGVLLVVVVVSLPASESQPWFACRGDYPVGLGFG